MGGGCANIAVSSTSLMQRHFVFCQRLNDDAGSRLKEWIKCAHARQKTCGGSSLPSRWYCR
jgi:hypothetical protein